jgi:predicted  nucleic acid-binding Zn-ribbon protein
LTEIARLYELQKLDTNTEKANRHLQQLKKVLAEPPALLQARDNHSAAQEELAKWTSRQRELELELRGLNDRIAAADKKLMGGTNRNPKALEDLQQSIAAMRRQLTSVDETAVEALMQSEEASQRATNAADALASIEKQWAAKHEEWLADEVKTKRIVLQLRSHRAKMLEAIPAADQQLYEDLRKRRAGVAVATIVNGQCSACNVKVPTGVVSGARSASAPAYCTSCGRILMLV